MITHPKYNRGNLYLSGGMEKKKGLGSTWRKNVATRVKEMGYFPIDITALDRAYAKEHGELFYSFNKSFEKEELLKFKSNIRRHFIYTDIELVLKDTDALIVLWDEAAAGGGGTHNEISEAYSHGIPILMVSSVPVDDIPGWIIAQTTKIFTRWEQLFKYLDELPFGILRKDVYGNYSSDNKYLCSLCGDPFEKQKHHYVSHVSPLYCKGCINAVKETYEDMKDRYQFFVEHMEQEAIEEMKKDET